MLNQETLLDYIRKAQVGDNGAKEKIFEQNSPLIKSIIRRFKDKGVEYEDLYQIACIGFMKAINNFDESYEVKFSTYCVPMVIGEIKRYIRDNGAIKVSRTLKILANKINRFIDEYQATHSDSPSVEIIAQNFGVDCDEVVVALDCSKMPLSIYDKFEDEDEGQELVDRIPSADGEDSVVDKIHLSEIISGLTDREKKIVILRLGVSQVQISRLENKIMEKIRLKY